MIVKKPGKKFFETFLLPYHLLVMKTLFENLVISEERGYN
jgi:hypothetical protein